MAKKVNTPESIYFSDEYVDIFMQAVANASKHTQIHNDSIFRVKETREIQIFDTRAYFLIEVGQQYQKLIDEKDGRKG